MRATLARRDDIDAVNGQGTDGSHTIKITPVVYNKHTGDGLRESIKKAAMDAEMSKIKRLKPGQKKTPRRRGLEISGETGESVNQVPV